ncbi:hypothetical protein [Mollivirus kamchatka]|nr:hypothetical protein [Mollivirus kamchatka]
MDDEEVRPCKRARLEEREEAEEEKQWDLLTCLSLNYGHVIVRVASFLDLEDVVNLACACKTLVEVLRDDAQTWRSLMCAVSIKVTREAPWDPIETQEAIHLASLGALGPLLPLVNNVTHSTMNRDMSLAKSHIDEALRLVRMIRRMSHVHDEYLEETLPIAGIYPVDPKCKARQREEIQRINLQVMTRMDDLMLEAFGLIGNLPLSCMVAKWMRACSCIYGAPREYLEYENMTLNDYYRLHKVWKKLCARTGKHMSSVSVNLAVWFMAIGNALIQETDDARMHLLRPSEALGRILTSSFDLAARNGSCSVHVRVFASPLYKALCQEEQACASALQRLFVDPCGDNNDVFVYATRTAMARGLVMPTSFDSPLNSWLCKAAVLEALSSHSDDLRVVCDVVQLAIKIPRFWYDPYLASLLLQLLRDQNLDFMVEACSDETRSDMKRLFNCLLDADTNQTRRSKLLDCIDIINK